MTRAGGAALLALVMISACQASPGVTATPNAPSSPPQPSSLQPSSLQPAPPAAASKGTAKMDFEQPAEDRLPPPEVPPVERDGVRYEQATDGHSVGANQVGGVLVASDAKSGNRLWTLIIYGNPVDPKMEADAQWLFFTGMAFDADGRLRITNEAGKSFLVDVAARSVTPAP